MPDFKSLVGLEEQEQPTYTNDETVLFRNTTKVRRLVEAMERKEEEKDET
jgi:predicted HAD superfamily Cof-like phosphohydrolase